MRGSALLGALACALALAACGGDDDAGGGGSADKPVTLKVGVIPIADVAPLYVGIEQGFFKAEGLEIDPKTVKYLEVPFPDAVAALKAGRVDAIWVGLDDLIYRGEG
jgi:ABC-type nitrate/sulfonate/bicarbonate transport system substrate-binding protein